MLQLLIDDDGGKYETARTNRDVVTELSKSTPRFPWKIHLHCVHKQVHVLCVIEQWFLWRGFSFLHDLCTHDQLQLT
ncbi:hypothetical protein Mapa_010329 [Marchantia paleacea]|nr:hypothetical protein Mapa_010329 [Marchantia paleacea]